MAKGSRPKSFKPYLISGIIGLLCLAATSQWAVQLNKLKVKNKIISIELADRPQSREQGLSDRDSLEAESGMLFVFPKAAHRSFWMYHCLFNIDLAYINPQGIIKQIYQMKREPFSRKRARLKSYPSESDSIQYVLEVNEDWFLKNNIGEGDTVFVQDFTTGK